MLKKVKSKILLTVVFGLSGLVNYVFAHHALEYIGIEGYTTAKKGEFIFRLQYDYIVDDKDNPSLDHWEFTPGLSYGITNRLMFDFHTHFAKFGSGYVVEEKRKEYEPLGPSPFMESASFVLQYRVIEGWLVNIGVSGLYEIPFQRSRELLDSKEVYQATLIVSKNLGEHSNICFNFTYGKDGDEEIKQFALGAKTPVSDDPHGIAAGIEFLGAIEEKTLNWSVLPGLYFPLAAENIIFKTGLEFGKNMDSMRANITLMYRF